MATIGKIGDIGRDAKGNWRPGYMTHKELVTAMETATGSARAELVEEARTRMGYAGYPPFPEHLELGSPE